MPEFSNATNEIGELIRKLNEERERRSRLEEEKNGLNNTICELKDGNIDKFNAIQELKTMNDSMSAELARLAASIGGHYDNENNKISTNEEMILDSKVKNMEETIKQLSKDKERLLIVNNDLKRHVPRDVNVLEANDGDLDGSFLDLKQKNVIETLELRCRRLRKKLDMMKEENTMLRSELRVLCSADKNLQENFSDCKFFPKIRGDE